MLEKSFTALKNHTHMNIGIKEHICKARHNGVWEWRKEELQLVNGTKSPFTIFTSLFALQAVLLFLFSFFKVANDEKAISGLTPLAELAVLATHAASNPAKSFKKSSNLHNFNNFVSLCPPFFKIVYMIIISCFTLRLLAWL